MRLKSVTVTLATALVALFVSAAPSVAHVDDGTVYKCGRNGNFPLCLYYNSNLKGPHVGIFGNVWNYDFHQWCEGCDAYRFEEGTVGSAGYWQYVKNNTASVYNYNDTTMRVYYNTGYTGPADEWDPYGHGVYFGNLSNTYNENASQRRMCGEC